MQSIDDPNFYLNHHFEKQASKFGVLFVDERVDLKAKQNNVIIYGHNMKVGTMFADLLKYKKKDFYENHPTISFDTIYQNGNYKVVTAFYGEIYQEDNADCFKFYNYIDLNDEKIFQEYKKNIQSVALYPCEEIELTDSFIMLMTCTNQSEEGRFVIVAKKLN